jgi:hypothetical protein
MDALNEFLKDVKYRSLGKTKLKTALRGKVAPEVIDEYFATSDAHQVFIKPQKKAVADQYIITGPPLSFQLDIVVFGNPRLNKGFGYALLVVEILSRKAWIYPLKTHTMDNILVAYKRFVAELGKNPVAVRHHPQMVMADDEFSKTKAKAFHAYNASMGTQLYTNIAKDDHRIGQSDRLGIADRLCGTIKAKLDIEQKLTNTPGKWVTFVPDFIQAYNDTPHTTLSARAHTSMTPNQAFALSETDKQSIQSEQLQQNQAIDARQPTFEVGERVRVILDRNKFDTRSQRWSDAIYSVTGRTGYKYEVSDGQSYKAQELQKSGNAPGKSTSVKATKVAKAARTIRVMKAQEGIVPAAKPAEPRRTRANPNPTRTSLRPRKPVVYTRV